MYSGQLRWQPLGVRDIAPVFNLIQDGCRNGHFTDLYLQPRYMAGLGIQLFQLLAKRIRSPDKIWYRAEARVLTANGAFAGFLVLRFLPSHAEIYMYSLVHEMRGKGLGKAMLARALSESLTQGQHIVADCLPASHTMRAVLRALNFQSARPGGNSKPTHFFTIWNPA